MRKKIQTITILKSLKKGPVIKKKKEVKQLKVREKFAKILF